MKTCPSLDDIRCFVQGDGAAETLAAIERHLNDCPKCEAITLELTQLVESLDADSKLSLLSLCRASVLPTSDADEDRRESRSAGRGWKQGDAVDGRYLLADRIGAGGMGEVWAAVQQPSNLPVAIKFIRPDHEVGTFSSQFAHERSVLALMTHPNIARLIDAGLVDGREPYFVMELVVGKPLTVFCDDGKLSLRERLQLFLMVCRAVQHAHQRGIVHRDLKPKNVLVTERDHEVVPKVIDFGIAIAIDGSVDSRLPPDLGSSGLCGTLKYMAPEQTGADRLAVDTRADVFSLGAILFELVVGVPPLDIDVRPGAEASEIERVRAERRPLASERLARCDAADKTLAASRRAVTPAALAKTVAGELDAIIAKSLELSPELRHGSVADFSQDIDHYLSGLPVQAMPSTFRYRAAKFVRRNTAMVAIAMVLAATFLAGATGTLLGLIRSREAQRLTKAAYRVATASQAARAWEDGNTDSMVVALREMAAVDGALEETTKDWEWAYLGRAITAHQFEYQSPSVELAALHKVTWRETSAVAFSEGDGIRILGGDGRPLARLGEGHGEIVAVAVSPDGQTLATASADASVRVWDLSGENSEMFESKQFASAVALEFTNDGNRLVIAGEDSFFRMFDVATRREIARFRSHSKAIRAMRRVAGGNVMVAVGRVTDGMGDERDEVVAWDWDANEQLFGMYVPSGMRALAVHPSRSIFGGICGDQRIRMWTSTKTPELVLNLDARSFSPQILAFGARANDNDELLIGGTDGEVKIVDWERGRLLRRYRGHSLAITSLAVLDDSDQFVSASGDGTVRAWNALQTNEAMEFVGHDLTVRAVDFSPDSRFLVTGSYDRTVRIWDCQSRQVVANLGRSSVVYSKDSDLPTKATAEGGHTGLVLDVAFSPSGKYVASAGLEDHRVLIWEVATQRVVRRLPHPIGASAVDFGKDDQTLVTGAWDGNVRVWSGPGWEKCSTFAEHDSHVHCVAMSPDGRLIASGSKDRSIRIWRVEDGVCLQHLTEHRGEVFSIAFGPDGRRLASGGADGRVLVWDIRDGRLVTPPRFDLRGHSAVVMAVSFHPAGNRLASASNGSRGNSLRIWDLTLGASVAVLSGRLEVAFSPTGDFLATTDDSRIVRVMNGGPLTTADLERLERQLTWSDSRLRPSMLPPAQNSMPAQGSTQPPDLRFLGYYMREERLAKDGADAEKAVRVLHVPISVPVFDFRPNSIELAEMRREEDNDALPSRDFVALVRSAEFSLVLPSGETLSNATLSSWPDYETSQSNRATLTSSEPIDPHSRGIYVLSWNLPDAVTKGPFQVRFRDSHTYPIPEAIIEPLSE